MGDRVALDWRPSSLDRGSAPTQGYLGGVLLVGITWRSGGWAVWTDPMPSKFRPRRDLRFESVEEAQAAAERFVARWLDRLNAAAARPSLPTEPSPEGADE